MSKNNRFLVSIASGMLFALGALPAFAADNSPPTTTTSTNTKVNTEPGGQGKTSDRTPGNPDPQRTPNASSKGATGTDAGQTHEGTSDRTPAKK